MIRSESKQKDRCVCRMATMRTTAARSCAYGHGIMLPCRSRQDISRAFNILVEFEAIQYLYSIQYSSRIKNVKDIRFK